MNAKCDICGKELELNPPPTAGLPEPVVCDDCKVTLDELSDGKGEDDNE